MAIAFDDDFNLKIPGFEGVRLGVGGAGGSRRKGGDALGNMYPTMQKSNFTLPSNLAKNVEKFRLNPNGTLSGWVPDAQGRVNIGETNYQKIMKNSIIGEPTQDYGAADFANERTAIGSWFNVEGLRLDKTTLSGEAVGDVYIEDMNGPIAVFKQGDQVNGYMRFAVQNQKTADNLRLGNNSGTTSNVRQNAQRRTLL